jgi:peptidoglycan/LPS O-acetylase OafA/YrhL
LADTGVIFQAGERRSARVESLRALAALAVVSGHIYGSAHAFGPVVTSSYARRVVYGGGFGVFLFFVLTGYLLFWPFVKEGFGHAGGRVDLRAYARNRALRILPLYYAVVVVMMVAQEHGGTPGKWLAFLIFSENFSRSTLRQVDGVLWSLVIELQFYLLLPLLAALLLRLSRRSLRRAALLLAIVGAAGLAFRLAVVNFSSAPDPRLQYSLPSTFMFFTAGMLLAMLRLGLERRRLRWAPGADVLLLASVPLWGLSFYRYAWTPLCALAAALMVGACVLPLRPGPLVRALGARWLAAIGVASYSLYLWHFPIVTHLSKSGTLGGRVGLSYLTLVPLTLAVACASYMAIEAPFLRLRRRWAASAPAHVDDAAELAPEPLPETPG